MTELLGLTGDLRVVLKFIEQMPIAPTFRILGSLLTTSRNRDHIDLAENAAERIFQLELEHDNTCCYVLLLLCTLMLGNGRMWKE